MIEVYSKPACPQCVSTKQMMDNLGIEYTEIDMARSPEALDKVMALGHRSAPVVITENDSWAGFRRDKIESLASEDESVLDDIFA